MPTASINGARLNYMQVGPSSGAAEELVMVHGLATNLAFWYLPYATAFADRYRVTVFDLRGHGRSELTPSGYTPEGLAADLEGLLDHLGIERAHFVAHSFGGVVTLGLARRNPARIKSLVLADTQVSATRHMPGDEWAHSQVVQSMLDRHGIDLDARSPAFGFELLTAVAELLVRDDALPEDLIALVGPTLGKHQRRTAKRWLDLIGQARQELMTDDGLTPTVLRSFRFPMLMMYGERSKAHTTSRFLRTLWPHGDFHTVPDAGHFFPSSRAAEVMAQCERFWDSFIARPSKVAI